MTQSKETLLCKKYYSLWKEGKTLAEIKEGLGIGEPAFKKLQPDFLVYCRHRVKHDTIEKLRAGLVPDSVPLTSENRAKFLKYAEVGMALDKISNMIDVPLITIMDYWFVIDPDLQSHYQNSAAKADAEVEMALKKKALGHGSKTVTVTTTEEYDPIKGKKMTSVVTSETERPMAGDIQAQKFWLINRVADRFSLDGEGNRNTNKGKILEAIEEIVAANEDKDDKMGFKES